MGLKHAYFISRTVLVRNGNVDEATRILNRILGREGIFDQFRRTRYYEKPTQTEARVHDYLEGARSEVVERNQAADLLSLTSLQKMKTGVAKYMMQCLANMDTYGGDLGELNQFIKLADRHYASILARQHEDEIEAEDLKIILNTRVRPQVGKLIHTDCNNLWPEIKEKLLQHYGRGCWSIDEV